MLMIDKSISQGILLEPLLRTFPFRKGNSNQLLRIKMWALVDISSEGNFILTESEDLLVVEMSFRRAIEEFKRKGIRIQDLSTDNFHYSLRGVSHFVEIIKASL